MHSLHVYDVIHVGMPLLFSTYMYGSHCEASLLNMLLATVLIQGLHINEIVGITCTM